MQEFFDLATAFPTVIFSALLAVVFVALTMWRPAGAIAFLTVALGLALRRNFPVRQKWHQRRRQHQPEVLSHMC